MPLIEAGATAGTLPKLVHQADNCSRVRDLQQLFPGGPWQSIVNNLTEPFHTFLSLHTLIIRCLRKVLALCMASAHLLL